ncbi:hypothetical protein GGI21_004000, partial [Coemansia aciculifera]
MHRWSSQRTRVASIKGKRSSELHHIIPLPPLPDHASSSATGAHEASDALPSPNDYIVPGFHIRSSQISTRRGQSWQTWLPEIMAKHTFCLIPFMICLVTTLALIIYLLAAESTHG